MDKPEIKSKGKDISIKDFLYGMILATILLLLWFYGLGGEASQAYGLGHTRIWIEKNKGYSSAPILQAKTRNEDSL